MSMNVLSKVLGSGFDEQQFLLRSLACVKKTENHSISVGRKSGTTILAMHFKDGVIIAGDRRQTEWHLHTDDAVKIEETNNLAAIGCAGTIAFIQDLKDTLSHIVLRLENITEMRIFVDGQALILKNILRENFGNFRELTYILGYAVPILVGFNPELQRSMIFEFDEAGGIYEKPYYATTGSGGILARTILEHRWRVDMKEADAVDLAIQAFVAASSDNYSSPPLLAPATVMVISKNKGIQSLGEEQALGMALTHHLEYLKRHRKEKELKFFKGEEV